jgi:hypothetical protein
MGDSILKFFGHLLEFPRCFMRRDYCGLNINTLKQLFRVP